MARTSGWMAICLLAVAFPASALNCGCTDDTRVKLECLLANRNFQQWAQTQFHGVSLQNPAVIVAWDHEHDQWSVYDWDGAKLAPRRGKVQLSNGTLQVDANTGDSVLMFATNTNPLVYSAEASTIMTQDTEEVDQLKALAKALGGLVQAWFPGTRKQMLRGCSLDALAAGLRDTAQNVSDLAADLDHAQTTTLSYMQVSEFGVIPVADLKEDLQPGAGSITRADDAMSCLVTARRDLAKCVPCRQTVDAAKTLAAISAKADRDAKLAELEPGLSVCIDADRQQLEQAAAVNDFAEFTPYERAYALLDTADQMIEKRQALFKTAAWLTATNDTAARYSANTYAACYFTNGIFAVRGGAIESVCDKKNTGGFHLTANVPLTDFQTRRAADVTKSVEVTSTTRWGIGAGIIYTPLKEKSWSTAPDPKDSTRTVIGQPSVSTRSGQIALLANLHPGWRIATPTPSTRLGLQFGAGTDTSKPAFFLGLSADLGRWLRTGGGGTVQRVKALTADEQEGAPIASGATVPTRDVTAKSWYLSLSLSLDGIPLFSAP